MQCLISLPYIEKENKLKYLNIVSTNKIKEDPSGGTPSGSMVSENRTIDISSRGCYPK